jgi:hypothetical protein
VECPFYRAKNGLWVLLGAKITVAAIHYTASFMPK